MFVSINRYERKKNIALALDALSQLKKQLASEKAKQRVLLVVAGGFDPRVEENLQYLEELQSHCAALDLKFLYAAGSQKVNPSDAAAVDVVFRTSISSEERNALIMQARGLLYTPDREHFGIVPLEAMYLQTPVIAVNSGGPRETVVHGATGYLCEQSADAFGNAMWMLIQPVDDRGTLRCEAMGVAAKTRVEEHFSKNMMRQRLKELLQRYEQKV